MTLHFQLFLLDLVTDILIQKYTNMKITVVGAGAVGATCADNIARKELAQ